MAYLPYLLLPIQLLIKNLAARGYEVTLVKTYPRDRSLKEEDRPECHNVMLDLLTRRLPHSKWIQPFVFAEFVARTVYHAWRARPDIVVAVDTDTLLQGYLVSRMTGARLVYYSLELYTERPGFGPKGFWVRLERLLINRAHLVVACEPNRARVMQEKYGARPLPMCVLNVPMRTEGARTDILRHYLRERGVAAKWIVLYQGAIARQRCMDQILEAARGFDQGIVAILVGPRSEDYDIDAAIAKLGVADRVFYYGRVSTLDELDAITASADLGVQVQLNLGLNTYYCAPCKLFQYLMAGLPVVASNFPGMIEVVEGNGVGACVNPESPDEIAAAVNRLLGDTASHDAMAAKARELARERYCYEAEGAKLLEAIDELAGGAARPASGTCSG